MPTDHEQAFGAQILKKCFHAKISETFHPLPAGTHCAMRQVPLERYINIAVNGCSGLATSTHKGPSTAMLISRSRGTCLIRHLCSFEFWFGH